MAGSEPDTIRLPSLVDSLRSPFSAHRGHYPEIFIYKQGTEHELVFKVCK